MIAVYLFGGILALLLVSVVVAALLERPGRPAGSGPATARERQDEAIEALRDIEFEYQTGKLAEEDYARLRARWAREALAARDELRARDAADASTSPAAAAGRGTPAGGDAAAGAVCPTCGSEARPDARYCERCGGPLAAGGRRDG